MRTSRGSTPAGPILIVAAGDGAAGPDPQAGQQCRKRRHPASWIGHVNRSTLLPSLTPGALIGAQSDISGEHHVRCPPVAGHPLVICVRTVRTRRSAGPSVDPSDPRVARLASGHSTFSSAAAEVLSYLFPSDTALFNEQKDEASISRMYGGIHYRSDIEMGKEHGKRIAGYTVRFARLDGADR
jgi:hypothetical protein